MKKGKLVNSNNRAHDKANEITEFDENLQIFMNQ